MHITSARLDRSPSRARLVLKIQRSLLLTANGRRGARSERGGTNGRHRRSKASGLGTETQLLESLCIKLPRGIQAVRLLKLLHGVDGGGIPFASRLDIEGTVSRQRGLNFGNSLGSGSFLPPHLAGCLFCGFRMMGLGAGLRRRRFCGICALPLRNRASYTHTCCNEQSQGQVGCF